jgi:hypothetical protein
MSGDPFDVVTVRKAGRSTPSVGRTRQQEEEDDPFASVLVSRPKALTQGQVKDVSPLKIGAPSFQQFAEAGAELPVAPPKKKYDTAFAEDIFKRQAKPQPAQPQTSYATSDIVGRLARTTKAEANRPVEEFKQQVLDVLKAPLYAARQAVPAVTGMAAPFVEGAYNLLGQPEIAEFTRKTQQDIEQSFAPQSAGEAAVGIPLRLAGAFAPFMAAGATAAPLTVSAGLSGLQSQAKGGSFVEFLGDKLDSDVLKRIAASEYKTPADMVLDVTLGLTFGSLDNIVNAAKTTTSARAALRAQGAEPFVQSGNLIREGIQSGALDAEAMKPFLQEADKFAQQAKVRSSLPLSGAGARAVDVVAGLGSSAAQFGKNVASNVGAEAKLFSDAGNKLAEQAALSGAQVPIPKKPTQGRLDREEFSSRLGRALDAGDDAEVTRLLERKDEVLAGVAPAEAPAPLRPAFSGQTSVLNRSFAPSLAIQPSAGGGVGRGVGSVAAGAAIGAAGDEENRLRGAGVGALAGLGVARGGSIGLSTRYVDAAIPQSKEVGALVNSLRKGAKQAEEFGLTANVELASMKDKRFAGVEDLGEDALELQLGAVNGTVEPLAKAAGLRMGRDVVAKPSFGLWFGETINADVQPSVLLQFGKDVDRKKALAVVAEYSRIAKQKAMFFMEPDDNGTRLALSFVVRDADGTSIPSNLVLDLAREGRAGWNGAMLTDDASRTILALDEGIGLPQAQAEMDRITAVLQSAGFLTEVTGAARVNAAEVGERGYAALTNSAGMERGAWARAVSDAERLYEGVAVTAEKQIAARRILNRPDAETLALNLDPNELAAVRTAGRGGKPGRIYTGPNHRGASYYAQRAGYKGALEDGYTLTNGEFVSRFEAEAVMELMAERGDKLAERSVNAVQNREINGRTSVLRSEDIYKADKNNELTRRIGSTAFDIGGALGEGVSALSKAPGGMAQIGKVGLGAVGYGLSQAEDERLQGHGNALMGLAAYSLVHGKVKQGAKAAGAAVSQELAKSPTGRKVLDEISMDIRVDPRVKETVDVAMREMAKYRAVGRELAAEAKARGGVFDRTVSDLVERETVEAGTLSPEDMEIAIALAQKVADNSLGLKKVEARLMSADTYAKRGTAYLPRRYAKYEAKDVNDVVVQHKGKTFRISGEKIRNDALTREERDALGEIREASYRIADYFGRGSKDIATAHLFESLSEIPGVIHPDYVSAVREAAIAADLSRVARTPTATYRGSPTAGRDALRAADAAKARAKGLSEQFKRQGQEYVTLPDTPQLGVLRGAVVRKDAAAYLNDLPDFKSTNRTYNRLMHYWKSAHTVFNVPATHLTNMSSNVFMGILGGLPFHEQVIAIPRAVKDIMEYGPTTRFLTEAGVIDRALPTYGDTPIKGLARDETVLRGLMKTTRPETREALEAQGLKGMGWMEEKARKVGGKIEQGYSLGDTMFRVALFDKLSKQGMTNEDALKEVMRVFPGYDTRSPILQKLKHISPFVMYPAKYLPAALNLIAEHPWRWAIASGTWAAIDQASRSKAGAVREKDLPPNRRFGKGGYLVPGPIQAEFLGLKSKEAGKRLMFDMARYTPFTALTGSPAPGTTVSAISEKLPGIVQPSGPLADIIARGVLNVDPFSGKPFIKKSDDAMDKLKKFTVGTTEAGRFSPGLAASLLLPSSLAYHLPNLAKDLYYGNAEAAKMSAAGLVGGRPVAVKRGQQASLENYKLQEQIREVNAELKGDLRAARDMVVRRNLIKKAMEKRQRLVKESRQSRQP